MARKMANTPAAGLSLAQQNAMARSIVLQNSIKVIQDVREGVGTFEPASNPVIVVKPKMTGLVLGTYYQFTFVIENTSTTANLTLNEPLGISNLISSIDFEDINGTHRITTDLLHLLILNAIRNKKPLGSKKTLINPVIDFGNNFATVSVPSSIPYNATGNATGTVSFYVYIPFAYSDVDLRGAIYANVINASMQTSFTINPNAISSATSNPPLGPAAAGGCAYYGATGNIQSVTVSAKQVYLTDLPAFSTKYGLAKEFNQGGYVMPYTDLNTMYQLSKISYGGTLSAGAKSQVAYAALRTYLSSLLLYNNGNELNAGTDITEISIKGANEFEWLRSNPMFQSLLFEDIYEYDLPAGMYLVSRRSSPINTAQFGNMYIDFEPSTVNTGATLTKYDEYFGYTNLTNTATAVGA